MTPMASSAGGDREDPETTVPGAGELGRQLATLTMAEVGPSGSTEAIQAVAWWNMLARLGLMPPLVVVHDVGLLLTRGRHGRPHRVQPVPRGAMVSILLRMAGRQDLSPRERRRYSGLLPWSSPPASPREEIRTPPRLLLTEALMNKALGLLMGVGVGLLFAQTCQLSPRDPHATMEAPRAESATATDPMQEPAPTALTATAAPAPAPAEPEKSDALFLRTVRPILAERCAPCHNPGGKMYARLPFDDPKTVAEKILFQYEIFRNTRYLIYLMGMPHRTVMRAIELLGTVVAPLVRAGVAERQVATTGSNAPN